MRSDIHVGDARTVLETLPAESVHCCVTSPPYFGLRDYGVVGQLGLEPTLEGYIESMVGVFREVRRVLRSDGTFWLNIGDGFAAQRGGTLMPASTLAGGVGGFGPDSSYRGIPRSGKMAHRDARAQGLKHKDLMMVPARLALALQADGWWLRSEIVWAKKAPMPESVTDRPTCSHEKIFLLTKSERYFYDAEAVREKSILTGPAGNGYKRPERLKWDGRDTDEKWQPTSGRNLRNVWHLGPENFPEAHFATFPTEIPRRAILAGSPQGGTVLDPFSGAGTAGVVAGKLGRDYIGIELNPEYAAMSEARILREVGPLLVSVSVKERV